MPPTRISRAVARETRSRPPPSARYSSVAVRSAAAPARPWARKKGRLKAMKRTEKAMVLRS
ncbi:MAG TPA: hypothetical protein VMT11_09065 [Myxococcaceae bacterium]|nr:hypothetical protein [Myxococcaceae bacterium]